jgi:serine protease inhibitor
MGVTKIFSPAAELPFIAEGEDLQVSSASQQASMEVNEKGTVVVTYTQINAIALSIQRDPPKVFFRVDRPFAAMICDHERGFPLVMAKISDPTKQ